MTDNRIRMNHEQRDLQTRPLVSIMMPAYERPELTHRAIQSVVEQEYRPIEIVLSDNCSPTSLEHVVTAFEAFEDECFSIRFYRQETNIGFCDNETFVFDRLTGKYAFLLCNDDWLTDKRFLADAVSIMEQNPGCNLCAANSELENANGQSMIELPPPMNSSDEWHVLTGDAYIRLLGEDGIGQPATSAVLFNAAVARSLGAMHYPFTIPGSLSKELGILGDEGYAFQYLLSSAGSAALSKRVVSIRGMPEESYSRTEGWQRDCNTAMFVIFYNIHSAILRGPHARAVSKRARQTIFVYALSSINLKILRHFRYRRRAVFLMLSSWAVYYARYYGRMLQRVRRLFAGARHGQWKEIAAKVQERGVLHSLLPFLFRH